MFGSKSDEISRLEKALKTAEKAHVEFYKRPTRVIQIIKTTNTLNRREEIVTKERQRGHLDEDEKVIRTFNDEGKLIDELTTYIHVDESDGEKTEGGWKTEFIYHDDKTEVIDYYDLEGKNIQHRTLEFFDSDGRKKREEVYYLQAVRYTYSDGREEDRIIDEMRHVDSYYYDTQGRLERIETEFYWTTDRNSGKDVHKSDASADQDLIPRILTQSFKYKNDNDQNPYKEVYSETGGRGHEEIFVYKEIFFYYDQNGRKKYSTTKTRNHYSSDFNPVSRIEYFYNDSDELPFVEIEIKESPIHKSRYGKDVIVTSHRHIANDEHGQSTVDQAQEIFNSLSAAKKMEFVGWAADEGDSERENSHVLDGRDA